MLNRKPFFDTVRGSLFAGSLTAGQVAGMEALLNACVYYNVTDLNQIAYVLATAYHEVNKTMQPIAEFGRGRNRKYGQRVKYNGQPYTDTPNLFYGRGFTQNTWYDNYKLLSALFNVDLISNPDLLITDINLSAKVSVYAMKKGVYTGKKLSDYINAAEVDFFQARRIINILDKAALIAHYAEQFRTALLFPLFANGLPPDTPGQ